MTFNPEPSAKKLWEVAYGRHLSNLLPIAIVQEPEPVMLLVINVRFANPQLLCVFGPMTHAISAWERPIIRKCRQRDPNCPKMMLGTNLCLALHST